MVPSSRCHKTWVDGAFEAKGALFRTGFTGKHGETAGFDCLPILSDWVFERETDKLEGTHFYFLLFVSLFGSIFVGCFESYQKGNPPILRGCPSLRHPNLGPPLPQKPIATVTETKQQLGYPGGPHKMGSFPFRLDSTESQPVACSQRV